MNAQARLPLFLTTFPTQYGKSTSISYHLPNAILLGCLYFLPSSQRNTARLPLFLIPPSQRNRLDYLYFLPPSQRNTARLPLFLTTFPTQYAARLPLFLTTFPTQYDNSINVNVFRFSSNHGKQILLIVLLFNHYFFLFRFGV